MNAQAFFSRASREIRLSKVEFLNFNQVLKINPSFLETLQPGSGAS